MKTTSQTKIEVEKLHGAYRDGVQLQAMFSTREKFVAHMLGAEWSSDDNLRDEFANAEAYVGYCTAVAEGRVRVLGGQ